MIATHVVANLFGMPDAVIYVLAAWVGIASGTVIVVGSIYGAMRIFRHQWRTWMDDELRSSIIRLASHVEVNGGDRDTLGTLLLRAVRKMEEEPTKGTPPSRRKT